MPIRLLCCSGSLEGGGSERQLWQLATKADRARLDPEIYLLYRRGDFLSQLPDTLPVHAFWSDHASERYFFPGQIAAQQVRHLSQVIQSRSVQVVYDRTFHMTLLTAAACRKTATPRVSVIVSPPSFDFARSRERFQWLKKRLLARAYGDPRSLILAVSNAVAADAADFYRLDRANFVTVPSPIDCAAVQRAALDGLTSRQPDFSDRALNVAIVGRLTAEKGHRVAIEAIARLAKTLPNQEVHLWIIGDGDLRSELMQLTNDFTVSHRVHFLGRQANPYPWMKAAGLLCIASEYEGLPNVVLEGMCLQTPIVSSNCSDSVKELLGNGSRGALTPVGDIAALMAAIVDRIEHAELWKKRALESSRWVQDHHGLDEWLERMQSLFEEQVQRWQK